MPASPIPSELEAKLLLPGVQELRALAHLSHVGSYPLRRRDRVRMYSLYLDTPDQILARYRVAFRLRRVARKWEATVKWAGAVAGVIYERPELTVALAKAPRFPFVLPPGPLRVYLCALVAGRTLAPVLVSDIWRRRIDVLPAGARTGTATIAEMALDSICLHGPQDGREKRYYEAEIEQRDGHRRDIVALARHLRRSFNLAPSRESKYARGLQFVYGKLPVAATPSPVLAGDSVEQATRKIVARHLRRLRQHDPGTRLGENPEALHDMRVATRRLRAVVRAFEAGVPPRLRSTLVDELRWLGKLLGRVRDLDVQLGNLQSFGAASPPGHRAGLTQFRAYLERERVRRRREMVDGLESERYFALLKTLEGFAYGAPRVRPSDGVAQAPMVRAGRYAVKKAFKRLLKRGDRIHAAPAPEDLHALRIRAKRIRYLLEFLRELTGNPGRRLVKQLVELQDLLGAYHDAVVAADCVRLYVEGPGRDVGASTLLALGALVGSDLRLAEHKRSDFQHTWRRFTRKRTMSGLHRVLQELHPSTGTAAPAPRRAIATTRAGRS